jgi:hypothetical protein
MFSTLENFDPEMDITSNRARKIIRASIKISAQKTAVHYELTMLTPGQEEVAQNN